MNHVLQRLGLMAFITLVTVTTTQAVTVTITDGDPCTAMGALINNDGDPYSTVAMGHSGIPSLPYISTPFAMTSHYASANRRAVAEFSLEPFRQYGIDPNLVTDANLVFYFDDVIYPGLSTNPWTAQSFALECYLTSANVQLNGIDSNDTNSEIAEEGLDDWTGEVIQSWTFQSGPANDLVPGQVIAGMYGPNDLYPSAYGDDQFAIYGLLGFEVDLTPMIKQYWIDPNVTHLGFRWINQTEGGYWTSMDPKGYLPSLNVTVEVNEPLSFSLQSTDTEEISGNHGGRPYHIFDSISDEAIYLSARDWQGGHDPYAEVTWPLSDGIIDWDVTLEPNMANDPVGTMAKTEDGTLASVYWNEQEDSYVLVTDENDVSTDLTKLYYEPNQSNGALNLGNAGVTENGLADRQVAVLTEFNLLRANRVHLDPNSLVSAHLEVTIDRIVDMTLSGNNMSLIPSLMYINSYVGDGILNDFTNAQADFERIDQDEPNEVVWLTLDGTSEGAYITDFALSYYRLVDPGTGEQFTMSIDVTELVREQLEENAEYAGFALSGSPDGEFTLTSVDLVDGDSNYLPKLVLETNLQ